jgi:hypothetical protein
MTTITASITNVPASPLARKAAAPASGSATPAAPSRKERWGGRTLSTLAVLFLAFDATIKLLQLPVAVEGTAKLGYPPSVVFALGLVQLGCLIAYVIPQSAVLGALLWTGYLGGAIATHVRVGDPLFSHVLFPVYVAVLLWGGLWLRKPSVRALFAPK